MTGVRMSASELESDAIQTRRTPAPRRPLNDGIHGFRLLGMVSILAVITAIGCAPSDREINAFIHAWEASVSAPDYRVQPPDGIIVSSPTAPELDGVSQVVRQDGKITLRLIGEVKVAGMTPLDISRKLESLLQMYYVEPRVSVRVSGKESKFFYVFGQVARPGAFRYTGRDTLLRVLATARPNLAAWKSRIKIIHPSHEDDKRRVLTVNVDRIMKEGRLDQNILLQEGDIIYVPPTPLAWVALRVREILWPVSPIAEAVEQPADFASSVDLAVDSDNYAIGG